MKKIKLLAALTIILFSSSTLEAGSIENDFLADDYCASSVNACGNIHICAVDIDSWISVYETTDWICWLHPGIKSVYF